eukprot:4586459-Prymnesium_polylepis.1
MRLSKMRGDLGRCTEALETKEWGEARRVVGMLLPLLTLKGCESRAPQEIASRRRPHRTPTPTHADPTHDACAAADTGESVKSRAAALAEAGETELAAVLVERRRAVLQNLSALDNALYAAQKGNKQKMLSDEALLQALKDSLEALDSLIAKL